MVTPASLPHVEFNDPAASLVMAAVSTHHLAFHWMPCWNKSEIIQGTTCTSWVTSDEKQRVGLKRSKMKWKATVDNFIRKIQADPHTQDISLTHIQWDKGLWKRYVYKNTENVCVYGVEKWLIVIIILNRTNIRYLTDSKRASYLYGLIGCKLCI